MVRSRLSNWTIPLIVYRLILVLSSRPILFYGLNGWANWKKWLESGEFWELFDVQIDLGFDENVQQVLIELAMLRHIDQDIESCLRWYSWFVRTILRS